jgi:hypothetical protein
MRRWLWVLMAAVLVPCTVSAKMRENDFAYGIRVELPAGTAIAAMDLPEQVYQNAFRRDLGDMRVFNAAGEPVPHMLRYARTRDAEPPWRSLAFFPVSAPPTSDTGAYRVHVRTGPDGAIVRIDPQLTPSSLQAMRTYLIDLSILRRSLARLRLEWPPLDQNWTATIGIDASDDLVAWTPVQPRATVADIRYGGRRLLRNVIELDRTVKRYLRLRQLDSGPAIRPVRILGRIHPEGRKAIRAVRKVEGKPLPDSTGVFEYRTAGAFPVDRVNLIFDQANSMAEALLESRSHANGRWQKRARGLFYRIDLDGTSLVSDPLSVSMTMDRDWRLTVDDPESTIGRSIPRLEIAYRPHDLFFIARGRGPFTIAFGSARAMPLKVNVAALFEGIGQRYEQGIERWVTPEKAKIVLGGPRRLSPEPQPLPTRRIVLWSILLLGVLVVAAMAWHLARRMIQ